MNTAEQFQKISDEIIDLIKKSDLTVNQAVKMLRYTADQILRISHNKKFD